MVYFYHLFFNTDDVILKLYKFVPKSKIYSLCLEHCTTLHSNQLSHSPRLHSSLLLIVRQPQSGTAKTVPAVPAAPALGCDNVLTSCYESTPVEQLIWGYMSMQLRSFWWIVCCGCTMIPTIVATDPVLYDGIPKLASVMSVPLWASYHHCKITLWKHICFSLYSVFQFHLNSTMKPPKCKLLQVLTIQDN